MGRLQAIEMASAGIDLDTVLHWHLTSNHYPPVPVTMVPVCRAALEAAEQGNWDEEIPLPEGVRWRGQEAAPAFAIIEGHHLESFLFPVQEHDDEN